MILFRAVFFPISHPFLVWCWIKLITLFCNCSWLQVWRSGNGVGRTNKAKLRQARLVLGLLMTFSRLSCRCFPGHSAWLTLRG